DQYADGENQHCQVYWSAPCYVSHRIYLIRNQRQPSILSFPEMLHRMASANHGKRSSDAATKLRCSKAL
ncbi:hypothetical protein M513_09666, partial [Trichuris suis]